MIYFLIAIIVLSFVSGTLFFFRKSAGPREGLPIEANVRSAGIPEKRAHEALQKASGAILGFSGDPQVYHALSRILAEEYDFQHVWIDVLNKKRARLKRVGDYQPIPGLDEANREAEISREAIHTGKTRYFTNMREQSDDWLAAYRENGIASLLVIPLGTRGPNWGTINLADRRERSLSQQDMENLKLISDLLSLSIELRGNREALMEKEGLYRALANAVGDGVVTINQHGVVLSVNQAFEKMFGYFSEEIVGRKITTIIPDDQISAHERSFAEYLKTGHRGIIGLSRELEAVKRDGALFPVELIVGDILIGPAHFFVGVIRDITSRQNDREKLRTAKVFAKKAIHRQAQILTDLAQQCSDPLVRIQDRIDRLLDTDLGQDQREQLLPIASDSEMLINNLNNVMEITKIQTGKWKQNVAPFEMGVCLEGIGDLLMEKAQEKGLDLVFQIEPNIQIESDEKQFRQAILTLVRFTIKKTRRRVVLLRCVPQKWDMRSVTLQIEIRGLETDPNQSLEKLSNHAQGSPTTESEDIARDLVFAAYLIEMMGGRLKDDWKGRVEPDFHLRIKMKRPTQDRAIDRNHLQGLRFLIVEKRSVVRESFMLLLNATKATLCWSEAGASFLANLRQGEPFHFIILSLESLESEAGSFLKSIRTELGDKRIPIIILCKASRQDQGLALLESGADFCLVEPLTHRRLMNAINSCYSADAFAERFDTPMGSTRKGLSASSSKTKN